MVEQLIMSVRASSLAELVWPRPDGRVGAVGVTALPHDDRPAVAFTYAAAEVAREVAAAPVAALTLTEPRSTGEAFVPLAAIGRPALQEDPRGEEFVDRLLLEELRRYPPARRLADSPLLCRENWWYLPRLIVSLDVTAVRALPARRGPDEHLLATIGEAGDVDVGVTAVPDQGGPDLRLSPEPAVPPGPAVLLGQDASFPDLEQWTQWRWHGRWEGSALTVADAPDRVGLEPVPGVLQRWRAQHDLARRCRRSIPPG